VRENHFAAPGPRIAVDRRHNVMQRSALRQSAGGQGVISVQHRAPPEEPPLGSARWSYAPAFPSQDHAGREVELCRERLGCQPQSLAARREFLGGHSTKAGPVYPDLARSSKRIVGQVGSDPLSLAELCAGPYGARGCPVAQSAAALGRRALAIQQQALAPRRLVRACAMMWCGAPGHEVREVDSSSAAPERLLGGHDNGKPGESRGRKALEATATQDILIATPVRPPNGSTRRPRHAARGPTCRPTWPGAW
jgi:hypothetical protein